MYGKKKKYNMGGKLKGMSHSKGGIPIEAEGGEFMIKKDSVNMDRSQTSYMGGGMVKPMYKDGGKVTPAQKNTLKKHSKHHSSKHMNEMKKDMIKGDSFTKSHKKALKKVGK